MTNDSIIKLLQLVAEADIHSYIFWNSSLDFFVNCNDLFFWGCADAERITEDSIEDLATAIKDAGDIDGPRLYCARRRKMRPQGCIYKYIDIKNWHLFDACGPERKAGTGNPKEQPK